MKIVFDSGVLITFSVNCFLPLFKELRDDLGKFIITKNVRYESIDRAENIMRFKLSSIRIKKQVNDFVFEVYEGSKELDEVTKKVMDLTNNMFFINKKPLKIIQIGEAESLGLLSLTKANFLAVDERTTRMLIENPESLIEVFKKKHHNKNIVFDRKKYNKFIELIGNVKCVRSCELYAYAYRNNFLPEFLNSKDKLKAALFAIKFSGCSVSFKEINDFVKSI